MKHGCGKAKHVIGKDGWVAGQTKKIRAHPVVVTANNSQTSIFSNAEKSGEEREALNSVVGSNR